MHTCSHNSKTMLPDCTTPHEKLLWFASPHLSECPTGAGKQVKKKERIAKIDFNEKHVEEYISELYA